MTGTRRIVIFRTLGLATLSAAVAFRAFRWRVIYIEPVGMLRTSEAVARLNRYGIEWVDYHSYPGFRVNADLDIANRYARKLIYTENTAPVITRFCTSLPGMTGRERSVRALLFDQFRNLLGQACAPYALAEYFRDLGHRADVFHSPALIERLLVARGVTNVRNLHPSGLIGLAVKLFAPIIWRSIRASIQRVRRQVPDVQAQPEKLDATTTPYSDGSVALILHKGLSYNQLYTKDQYFSDDPYSPFHPSRLRFVELGWMMDDAWRTKIRADYQRRNLPVTFLDLPHVRLRTKIRTCMSYYMQAPGGAASLVRALIMAQIEIQVRAERMAFQALHGLRLALIDSDNLFPRAGTVALQSLGIQVVALQERFISAFHDAFVPLFDHFFVHGDLIRERINANPFAAVGRIVATGDPRRTKITNNRAAARAERAERFAKYKHICLVLDFQSPENAFDNAKAYGPDWRSNILFYQEIAALAEANPDCAFIVRGKDCDWTELEAMAAIRQCLERQNNLFIDKQYSTDDRSHFLAAMSDVVIARYTSLCDQCLAEGIPVIVLDIMPNGGDLISSWLDYEPYPVVAHDTSSLHNRFEQVIRHGQYMDPEQFQKMRKHFYTVDVKNPHQRVQQELLDLLNERRNDVATTKSQIVVGDSSLN